MKYKNTSNQKTKSWTTKTIRLVKRLSITRRHPVSKPSNEEVTDEEDKEGEEDHVPHEFVVAGFGDFDEAPHRGLQQTAGRVKFVVHVVEEAVLRPDFIPDVDRERFQGPNLTSQSICQSVIFLFHQLM